MRYLYSVAIVFGVLLASCKGKNETIPAYVQIDSLMMQTTAGQGSNVHDLSAFQLYLDGDYRGYFELPARVPLLAEGKHKITLIPAVRLNGAANQFSLFRSLQAIDTTVTLTAGQTLSLEKVIFRFRSNCQLPWAEDFEDNSATLIPLFTAPGDTSYITTEPFSLKGRFSSDSKVYTAFFTPSDTLKYMDLMSFATFSNLPVNGTDIFLELDVKSPIPVQVSLQRITSSKNEYVPYLYINETGGLWKRFYINLTYELAGQPSDVKVRVLLSLNKPAELNQAVQVHIDNLRLNYLQ
ncbi:MAG: hypothetical protein JNL57_07885 [Bacteroidetes bacterium]|nr:hypothetical protein [Bacteroidota bacterium]